MIEFGTSLIIGALASSIVLYFKPLVKKPIRSYFDKKGGHQW